MALIHIILKGIEILYTRFLRLQIAKTETIHSSAPKVFLNESWKPMTTENFEVLVLSKISN